MATFLLGKTAELLGLLSRAFAQTGGTTPSTITITPPIAATNFGVVSGKIIDAMMVIAIPIVAIMVLYGGFQIMTAGGDPEKFTKGRKTILYAAVGFVVVLVAKSVSLIVQNTFK